MRAGMLLWADTLLPRGPLSLACFSTTAPSLDKEHTILSTWRPRGHNV